MKVYAADVQVEGHRSRVRGPLIIRLHLRSRVFGTGRTAHIEEVDIGTILIRANLIELKFKGEMVEPSQRGKDSDHHPG